MTRVKPAPAILGRRRSVLRTASACLAAAACAAAAAPAAPAPVTAQADFDRGVAFDLGKKGPPDARAALDCYRRAAAAELPAAQLNAAVMYDSGRGTPSDPAQAAIWYGAAAAHGDGRAAYDMGQLYADGEGVPRNAEAARAWFALATARGIRAAAHAHIPPPGPAGDSRALMPSTPLRPNGGSLQPQGHDIALVWAAPAEPAGLQPIATYIQLVVRAGASQRVIYAGFAPTTAALVKLPAGQAEYAWRTLTVSAGGGHYLASEWARFTANVSVD